ncbi:MAG: TonB-dependent receptor [Acidobacteriota bacterium]
MKSLSTRRELAGNTVTSPFTLALARIAIVTLVVMVILGAGSSLSAQTITGTILGTVTDNSGGVMPGVSVTAKNTGTAFTRSAVSDDKGRYELRAMPIGPYEVTAELEGFKKQIKAVQLTVGAEVGMNFAMDVGGVEQTVVVTAEAPVVQTNSTEMGALIDQKQIQQLPLNARDIQQLAVLQPGVQSQSAYNGLYGANITVRGSRPEQNRYLLNGVDASTSFGTSPVSAANILMGVEGLQEFKVMSSDYSAAYGVKQGGVVNMVTKAGTNDFRGSAYEFHRDDKLDAPNYFDLSGTPPFKRDQFGGAVGGPIVKGQTFFFVNYEQYRHRLGLSNIATVPTARAKQGYAYDAAGNETYVGVASQMVPFLALMPDPNGSINAKNGTGQYQSNPIQKIDEKYVTARIDHRLSPNDQLWGVYTGDWSLSVTPEANPNFGVNSTRNKQIWSLENVHTFSNHLLNTTRAGLNRNYYFDETTAFVPIASSMYVAQNPFLTPSANGQFESIGFGNGMTGMANSGNAPVWFNHTGISLDTEFSYLTGAHTWKFGGSWLYAKDAGSFTAVQARGEISFDTWTQFLQGVATRANILLPGSDPKKDFRSHTVSFYAEDNWRVSPRLTASLGVRYDLLASLKEANGHFANLVNGPSDLVPTVSSTVIYPEKNNFAPRLGFNWDASGDGKTSVRGGGGMFYNLINAFSLRESSNNVPITTQYSLNNVPFPAVFTNLNVGSLVPDFGAIQSHPQTPVLYSYHLSGQRDVGYRTSVTVSFVGSEGRHLPSGTIVNSDFGNRVMPTSTNPYYWAAGGTRPNPNFGRIGFGEFIFNSSYKSVQTSIDRRVGEGLGFTAAYTWSRCMNQGSGELNTALGNGGGPGVFQYARDPSTGYGPCSFTSTHNATFTTTWDLPGKSLTGVAGAIVGGWRWSTITTVQSGYPFNVTTGFNRSRQNVTSSGLGDRPNWASGCDASSAIVGTQLQWFNPACFVMNDAGYLGNVPAMALRGPGLFTSDWSLAKSFGLSGGKRLEFQVQAFNITNRANFRTPTSSLFANATTPNVNAGKILATVTASRQMQLGVKFVF